MTADDQGDLSFVEVAGYEAIAELARLAAEIWQEAFTYMISDEQIAYMLERFQSAPALTRQIEDENYRYWFVRLGAETAGYLGVQPREKTLFLSKVYLLPARRGHGLGAAMLRFAAAQARRMGLCYLELTVNRSNPALRLYQREGFQIVREAVADIGGGFVMDDYILVRELDS
ncbi:MAG: GNAT family N-acetyltransferase [Bacillota bacterium]|nr:GNAT family N-acetyltransferase [Bacillota bacterium]